MAFPSHLWPRQDERRPVGRCYLASGISELFNVVWPFQFAYLFMILEWPEWAVIPLLVESASVLTAVYRSECSALTVGRARLSRFNPWPTCGYSMKRSAGTKALSP